MLHNRIKSKSGATILIALMFFLLCAMAGSIILAAGTASAGSQAGVKEQEQAYYTVTSAAQLIKGQIENQQFGYQETTTTLSGGSTQVTEDYVTEPSSQLKDLLKKAGKHIFDTEKDYIDTITVKPADSSAYPELSEVSGDFRMDAKTYSIEIILSIRNTKGEGMYTCKVSIPTVQHDVKIITTGINGTSSWRKIETSIVWGKATITKE